MTSSSGTTSTSTPPRPLPPDVPSSTRASVDVITSDGTVLLLSDGSVYSVDSSDQSVVSSWSQDDDVAVNDSGDAITNLSTGEKVSVSLIGNESSANIYVNTGDHALRDKSDDGSVLLLDDGSVWVVALVDRVNTGLWLAPSSIAVNEGSGAAYELVNADDQETAEANYIGRAQS
jgi:hypothetical protein